MFTTQAGPQPTITTLLATPTTTTTTQIDLISSTNSYSHTAAGDRPYYTSSGPRPTSTGEPYSETVFTAKASFSSLESKHVFGIVVAVIMLVVLLLVVALATLGLLLLVKSRRRGRNHQFVETFIQTSDNEAYQSRTTLLIGRSNGQERHLQTPPNSHPNSIITTTDNVAYCHGTEFTNGRTSAQSDITGHPLNMISLGPSNTMAHSVHSHSTSSGTIETRSNVAYQAMGSNETSGLRSDVTHSSTLRADSRSNDPSLPFDMEVNKAYSTDVGAHTSEVLPGSGEVSGTSLLVETSDSVSHDTGEEPFVEPYVIMNLACV